MFVSIGIVNNCPAEEFHSFKGKVTADNINIRSDATVSAQIIYAVSKRDTLEAVSELYDWYKVRLPSGAPAFIKKNLVTIIEPKIAQVTRDRVNIRLKPDESSNIIGKTNKNERVSILEDMGEWYKIKPVDNSFGWIHKKFLERIPEADSTQQPQPIKNTEDR